VTLTVLHDLSQERIIKAPRCGDITLRMKAIVKFDPFLLAH